MRPCGAVLPGRRPARAPAREGQADRQTDRRRARAPPASRMYVLKMKKKKLFVPLNNVAKFEVACMDEEFFYKGVSLSLSLFFATTFRFQFLSPRY